jgi:hypothetical protein
MTGSSHAAAASSEITAAHPKAAHEQPVLPRARPHTTDPLPGCACDTAQTPPPSDNTLPLPTVPSAPGTSSPHALRLLRCAPAVAHSLEAVRSAPCAEIPNSCCDQNAAPTPPGRSRSAAITRPTASPLPGPSPVRRRASNDPEAGPPLHSATRPPPRPCPGQVVPVLRPADSHR